METLNLHLTTSLWGITAVVIFVGAYILAMLEEITDLRKSKPVLIAAALIWVLLAAYYANLDPDKRTRSTPLPHQSLMRSTIKAQGVILLLRPSAMPYWNMLSYFFFFWLR